MADIKRLAVRAIHATPRPTRINPFQPGSQMARMYEGMLTIYASGHRDILREDGKARCMGNSMADNFWLGYDNAPPSRVPRNTLAWACYRAGQTQRLRDDARGVYVPPKTNSIVPRQP